MRWSSDKANSFNSFKECYENKLKPQNKYRSNVDAQVKRFFEVAKKEGTNEAVDAEDESIYDLLSRLETNNEGCVSICNKQPFYLT